MLFYGIFIWGLVVARPTMAGAEECELPYDLEEVLPASECPEIFGSDDERQANGQRRVHMLKAIQLHTDSIDIVHYGTWDEPNKLDFEELELVATRFRACRAHALVDLRLEHHTCRPGLYAVSTDDSLGPDTRILAVLPDVLLIERNGELRFMQLEYSQTPNWRKVWTARWEIIRPITGKVSSSRGSKGRSRNRRRRRR